MEEIRRDLKSHFVGNLNIPEVISYINEINSLKTINHKNISLRIYYKTTDNLNFDLLKGLWKEVRLY